MGESYTCELCGGTFEKYSPSWTDAKAMQESHALFGAVPPDELGVVCDPCFHKFMEWALAEGIIDSGPAN